MSGVYAAERASLLRRRNELDLVARHLVEVAAFHSAPRALPKKYRKHTGLWDCSAAYNAAETLASRFDFRLDL
jgi:hypothetical protein